MLPVHQARCSAAHTSSHVSGTDEEAGAWGWSVICPQSYRWLVAELRTWPAGSGVFVCNLCPLLSLEWLLPQKSFAFLLTEVTSSENGCLLSFRYSLSSYAPRSLLKVNRPGTPSPTSLLLCVIYSLLLFLNPVSFQKTFPAKRSSSLWPPIAPTCPYLPDPGRCSVKGHWMELNLWAFVYGSYFFVPLTVSFISFKVSPLCH